MSVHLYDHKFSYVSVPKCACSSLKHFFFEVENGFKFQNYKANGRSFTIHGTIYKTPKFGPAVQAAIEGHDVVTVIRDPIQRFLSCFSDRVVARRELSQDRLRHEGAPDDLPGDPDLEGLVARLSDYRKFSTSFRLHSHTLSFFLGTDPGIYSRIYLVARLDEFHRDMRARFGNVPELPMRNPSQSKVDARDLPTKVLNKLKRVYEQDYDLFGNVIRAEAHPA